MTQSFSALQGAFLALSLHPTTLKTAQAELDAIVGLHRMPDFNDKDALVYVRATIMEVLRWHNGVPLGIEHTTTADDELRGWFIPKGTTVWANVWCVPGFPYDLDIEGIFLCPEDGRACMHDPAVYPDPDQFRPERFVRDGKIDENVLNPLDIVFGFGRRCTRRLSRSDLPVAHAH